MTRAKDAKKNAGSEKNGSRGEGWDRDLRARWGVVRIFHTKSALKDPRLVPGLMRVAAYHDDDRDYDCRPKWMAIAALAREESPDAIPLLVSLVDHGNQNTRMWARAALARMTKEDFKADKQAWNQWWVSQGHSSINAKLLEPFTPPRSK